MTSQQLSRDAAEAAPQSFELDGTMLTRRVELAGGRIESTVLLSQIESAQAHHDPLAAWWSAFLRGALPAPAGRETASGTLRTVDLFCGAGGLSVGVHQAAAELGMTAVSELAVDSDAEALEVYGANHDHRLLCSSSVTAMVDYRVRGSGAGARFSYDPEIIDDSAAAAAARADLLIAGPPCQGHSNLNNRSRRTDRRNHLMLTVPAIAVAAGIDHVIIENVPAALHDHGEAATTVQSLLNQAGYQVVDGVLRADAMGWPQTRRRYFIVASRTDRPLPLATIEAALRAPPQSIGWLLNTLAKLDLDPQDPLGEATDHNARTQDRIKWLFENDEFELELAQRPPSHRDGTTYQSVYGRMREDRPAPTITTGFTTPGRGRFVHPRKRRTLTPREAAAVQGFPVNYRFVTDASSLPARARLAKWIGDAVPMPLGYAAALSTLLHSDLAAAPAGRHVRLCPAL